MNTSAQTKPGQSTSPSVQGGQSTVGMGGKEHEIGRGASLEVVTQASSEMVLPKEIETVGVQSTKTDIEIPPDIKKIGVQHAGPTQPLTVGHTLPSVSLPLSDDQVGNGLHKSVLSALRWLSEWCVKKLKKAHIHLKKVHGHFIRVMNTS
jgi:hypothetical protein